jgi:hypothetical protein
LLEELAAMLYPGHAIDFSLDIYTNFDIFKNNAVAPPIYEKLTKISHPANRQHICHKPVDFIQFLPIILNNLIS